jgi:hypothetical protein
LADLQEGFDVAYKFPALRFGYDKLNEPLESYSHLADLTPIRP